MKQHLHSLEGVLIINNKGIIVLINPTINHLFNYSEKELIGVPLIKLISEELPDPEEFQIEQKVFTGIKKDGVEFEIKIGVDHFEGGKEPFTVVFISEIKILNSQTDSTSSNLPAVIFLILDKSINIKYVNKYGCTLLGCPEETLLGLNWYENFLPSDRRLEWNTSFDQAFATGSFEGYESALLNTKGEYHTILWTTYVIYDSTGEPVGTFNTGFDFGKKLDREIDLSHIDRINRLNTQLERSVKKQTQKLITSLANVETINKDLQLQIQKRKEIEQKLIKIQRLYDTVVHNFPDGVIGVLNRDMKYVLIDGKELNEIDLPALGLTSQGAVNNEMPETEDGTLSKIKKAFTGQHVSFEVAANDQFYHISAVPLHDVDNQISEILCVLKNVTKKNRLESGLLKALEKEKELGELKSRFVTMACHEFKTPLATILSSSFLLENYSGEDFEKEKLVHTNRIKRSVNNLTMILNQFLMLEENKVSVINSSINIPKFIRDIITEMVPVKQKGQSISYQHEGDENIFLDPHLLWGIITNLISNALKYSRQSDCITLKSEIHNKILTITGKDAGIGIPPNELNNIFGRFYRAKNALNFDGTGLGLHIVDKDIKLLKGSISFKSELNTGTEFIVTLPSGETGSIMTSVAIEQKI
ncbi:MAG: PAS domain-containing sensor histidine kinase [Cyclobacteriaceae bacterium]